MLYTTYRPQTLKDVVGQERNLITIREQIKRKSYDSAYLFAGHRGTGKTTIARILARTINCENPSEHGPCNKCKNCVSMIENSTLDFRELDAASHNSITDIKELVSSTKYLPTTLSKKIYIIDEVHNLSTSAFDALLKTIEEPPEHCIFILCTTELHKIPATIKSRCSIYQFPSLSIETIKKRLIYVIREQKKEYEEAAVDIIAKQADGSMRDALSIAEKLIISCNKLTVEHVKNSLCLLDEEIALNILDAIVNSDGKLVISIVQKAYEEGKNLSLVIDNLLQTTTDGILLLSSGGKVNLYNSETYVQTLDVIVKKSNLETLFWYVETFSNLRDSIRNSLNPYMDVIIYLIKCCNPKLFDDKENTLLKRINAIEDKIESRVLKGCIAYENQENVQESIENRATLATESLEDIGWESAEEVPFEASSNNMQKNKEEKAETEIEEEYSDESEDDEILGLFQDYL